MNNKKNTGYIILVIIVFTFGLYLLSPKPKKVSASQKIEWEPPKLEFSDNSMVIKKGVGVRTRLMLPIMTQEEIDMEKDELREKWRKRIVPKPGGFRTVETIELPEQGFIKYIERLDNKLWRITYVSHKEEHRLIDGRDFYLNCRSDGLCSGGYWHSLHGLAVSYDFGSSELKNILYELEDITQIPKEISESINKYYQENPQLIIKGNN